jgi:hypothetical protein
VLKKRSSSRFVVVGAIALTVLGIAAPSLAGSLAPAGATAQIPGHAVGVLPAPGSITATVVGGPARTTAHFSNAALSATSTLATAGIPGRAASSAPIHGTLTPHVIMHSGAHPDNTTKCYSGIVCQYLVSYGGKGLDLSSWTAEAWQTPVEGTICDPEAYFYYDVNEGGPTLWEYATFSGCETAPPGGEVEWTTSNAAPVYFSKNNHVDVVFDPIWGATPTAYVHS